MVNTYQSGNKTLFDLVKLFESQDRITHLPLPEPAQKDLADLGSDGFGIVMVKGADRRLTGIRQTEERQLTGTGRSAAVTEKALIRLAVRIFRLGFGVEEVNKGVPVVGPDGIPHQTAEPVFPGEAQTAGHMFQNDVCTLGGGESSVELVAAAVVFDEICRLLKFSDIVEECRRLGFEGVGTDGPGGIFGEGGDGHGVEQSSGGLTFHPFQKEVVVVAEHHEGHVS